MSFPELPHLPIVDVLDGLRRALDDHRRAVVSAPPGAGKTTVIPLALLDASWRGDGTIVILEPRRLATRAAARRMAQLCGQQVGELVGYQTRDERVIGHRTRIEVLTEGVLTRRLQADPELPGVAAVIFDEVHERNLTTDLGLALTVDVAATLRPDLRIAAMSATADTATFAHLLATTDGPAPVVSSDGRTHEIEVRWLPRRADERIEAAVAAAVSQAVRDEHGDVLAFLPGVGEIMRTRDRLVAVLPPGVDVHPLAGSLTVEEQDRAFVPAPPERRRVVLATDIAETSLTVEGVRIVVDSGLARAPRFDTRTGMTRLTTVAISRDSADQRAGRAGRTEPGVVYRLWSRIEHGTRPAHRPAEIASVDLAGLALELAAWGSQPDDLALPEPVPRRAWQQGVELLRLLGAVDSDGRITEVGRRMVRLPLHPRLARVIVESPTPAACIAAALVDERDIFRVRSDNVPADLELRVAIVGGLLDDERADYRAVGRARDRAVDIARRAGAEFDWSSIRLDEVGRDLLAGFPDRLAGRRRRGQFQLRSGTAAWVRDVDPLANVPFLVAVDLDGKRSGARIRLGAAVDESQIDAIVTPAGTSRLEWDAERDDLVERVELRIDALRLRDVVGSPPPGEATTAALIARVKATRLGVLPWTPATEQLRARLAFLREHHVQQWPDLSDRALLARVDDWLRPYLAGATGRRDLDSLDLGVVLRSYLVSSGHGREVGAELDELAPPAWALPNGRQAPIDYTADRPTASVRVQDVFGVKEHPRIAAGRVPLTIALLSPADRPIQVTADLPGFWAGSWAAVRKELAGRYPKHRWPEDPANEPPGRLKTP